MPDAAWMKDYRENNPDYVNRQRALEKARRLALQRLKERHSSEFARLFAAAKRELHIW